METIEMNKARFFRSIKTNQVNHECEVAKNSNIVNREECEKNEYIRKITKNNDITEK